MAADAVWIATPPNLLPVNEQTGGQALYFDWVTDAGLLTQPVTIDPLATNTTTDTSLYVGTGAGVSTRTPTVVPASIAAVGGETYRFSTGATGPVLVELYGVRSDGTMAFVWGALNDADRASNLQTLPAGFVGLAYRVLVLPPTAYSYPPAGDPYEGWLVFTWTDLLGTPHTQRLYNYGDGVTLPDPGAGVTLSGPVLVQGWYDPGPVVPTSSTDTFGALVWGSLPELYIRTDKEQSPAYPLRSYLQGAGVGSDNVIATARQVYEGDMTDPVACPDDWLAWQVVVLGVVSAPNQADQRQALAARQTAGRPGTTQNLEAYIQTMLTGTKYVTVRPPSTTTPWVLRVSVIDIETVNAGGTAGIRNRLLASGKLPAGHDVLVSPVVVAWDAVDAQFTPSWDSGDSTLPNWASIDSSGLGG